MKRFLTILLLFILVFTGYFILTSGSTNHDGKCTGSAYCSACKNCSACRHCNNGGSCGVCRGINLKSERNFYPTPRKTSNATSYRSINSSSHKIGVVLRETNVRSQPNTKAKIICTVDYTDNIEILQYHGEWIKIKVYDNQRVGYVIARNIY